METENCIITLKQNEGALIEHFNSNHNLTLNSKEAASYGYYFVCGICRNWYATTASLIIHFAGHFHERPACEICGETFTEAHDYADHCAQHVGYSCLVCDQTFFETEDFNNHLLEHKLNCFKCKETFASEHDLKLHYSEHEDIINLQCEMCRSYFSSKRSLNFHKSTQHAKSKQYECSQCEEKFTQIVLMEYLGHAVASNSFLEELLVRLGGDQST
ncbi:hypothetical protein CEXT_678601 [Caerostris extrusa]|uniref:C2H2-type domain-containing protein n=1 Tax=Caerostris extrusa TaxID=172846 RepID=A0AAV4UX44_CAEEX|nr:hypothetical protein CEXT_678601 [Caerostris extrusa]